MPGTNAGTGQPIVFRCARCRRTGVTHHNYSLTGQWKALKGSNDRTASVSIEYKCECKHQGWSRHIDIARRAVREDVIPSGTVIHRGRTLTKGSCE